MSAELVRYEGAAGLDLMQLGKVLSSSGYFSDTRDAAQAIVKVLAGQELGIGPIAAMTGIYLVNGRVAIGANLMAAAVMRSGKYTYRVRKLDESACEIVFFQGRDEIGVSTFTLADAKKAQTKNVDKFPRNMLFARAMSNGVRWFCPDVFSTGVYTPEELGEAVEPPARPPLPPAPPVNEHGEVIEDAPDRVRFDGPITDVQARFNAKGELVVRFSLDGQEHLIVKAPEDTQFIEPGDRIVGEAEWRTIRGKPALVVLAFDGDHDADGDTPWQARASAAAVVDAEGATFDAVAEPAL